MRFHSSNYLLLKRTGKDWFMPNVMGRVRLVFALVALAAANLFGQTAPPQPQTITFDTIPNKIFGVSPFITAAKASSGLAVSFASQTTSVCKNSGSLILLLTPGTCSIQATQPGNGTTFAAATPVNRSFTVSAAVVAGTLAPSSGSPFTTGTQPIFPAIGDFNEDGHLDVVIANSGGNNVTLLLGNGTGGFTPATASPFTAGTGPRAIAVGDFNNDGHLDIAVANNGSNNLTILLGTGTGGFNIIAGVPAPTTGTSPVSIAVGDFNGDGSQDLAVANSGSANITILLGNGTGLFAAAAGSPFAAGTQPSSIVVADFNGDGHQDVATANNGSDDVTVLLGSGAGRFSQASGNPFSMGAGSGPIYLAVGDFNKDGTPDLAVAENLTGKVHVLLGSGVAPSWTLTQPSGSPFTLGTTGPYSVVMGDFNADGNQDLAFSNFGSHDVAILLGTGTGSFSIASGSPFVIGASSESEFAAVGDFNGDGIEDLAVTRFNGNSVAILLGAASATTSVLTTTAPSTIVFGTSVPLTLAVSGTTFNPITGRANFKDGSSGLGTATQNASPYTLTASSLAVGTHTFSATYASGPGSLASNSNAIVIQVKNSQTITFNPLSDVALGGPAVTPSASSDSGLAVSFTSNTAAVCTIQFTQFVSVALHSVGLCSITASQAGNTNYVAATPVTQTFNVTQGSQTISFAPIENQFLGVSPFPVTAQVASQLPVAVVSQTTSVCKTTANLVIIVGTGTWVGLGPLRLETQTTRRRRHLHGVSQSTRRYHPVRWARSPPHR